MRKSSLALAPRSSPHHPPLADTLVDNVNGIQVDANGKLQHFTGILIGDDGKVEAAAAPAKRRPRLRDRRIDARAAPCFPA